MDKIFPAMLTEHGIEIRNLVNLYCSTERNSRLEAFQVYGPFDSSLAAKSIHAEKPGCYAIYTATGALKYIGMAKNIGYRSVSHFRDVVRSYAFWQQGSPASYIDLIVVSELWEPHSLEAYLTIKTAGLRQIEYW